MNSFLHASLLETIVMASYGIGKSVVVVVIMQQ
jgi:hypothetical protein